jgi:Zn-dependent peptidase ImmA (M78 family)/DNA-binding XRE family transcriptional regulator
MIDKRLRQARAAAGLSLRSLADRAEISAMAISKYERGVATPSSGVLIRLGKALDVPVEYFFRPAELELHEVEYRKHRKLPKKLQTRIEGDVLEQVERFFELMDLLPTGPISRYQPPQVRARIGSYEDIEEVAVEVRNAWELGINPIPDLTDTLEERGILVLQTKALHDNNFDGLAATVSDVPVIVVGLGWPGDRQRFTLAHELGHLVMKDRIDSKLDEERAAHRFAGAFLAPRSEVKKELGERRSWLELGELHALKKTYGLSMGGWLHRAHDLEILPDARYKAMYKYFAVRGWRKTEPGERYPREEPKLFPQLVFRALAEGLISESKGAELLRVPLKRFAEMRNLKHAANPRHQ